MTSAPGRDAASPWEMPPAGWKQALIRTWRETNDDNISLIAAGVAFYGFLALVPMLGAIVLSYGLLASPDTVMREMRGLTTVMPADAAKLIGDQLISVVETSHGKKGFGLVIALAIALYGAMKGAGAIVTALNIAYEEAEKRSFIRVNLLALAITVGGLMLAIGAVVAAAALGHLERLLPGMSDALLIPGKLMTYAIMATLGLTAAAVLFRYGPSRTNARWVWLTPGSLVATTLWLAITIGFGVYVANFGSYNATYGSLAAVVVMLTWLYLSAYSLLLGAELNSELERQTERDTTEGAETPLGSRGAVVADAVAGEETAVPTAAAPALEPAPKSTPAPTPAPARRRRPAGRLVAFAAAGAFLWWRHGRRRLSARASAPA